jgi:hypothetical protein
MCVRVLLSWVSNRKRSISPPDKEIKPKEEEKEQEKDNNHEFVPIVTVTPVATEQQLPQSSQQGDVGNNSQVSFDCEYLI